MIITKVATAIRIEPLIVPTKVKQRELHKADVDPWPSKLHAHFYAGGIKLDAITSDIYKVSTRKSCAKLKDKELRRIQIWLLGEKDFAERTRQYLGEARVAELMRD